MKNLCDTCRLDFATCVQDKIVFGIDVDPTARGAAADAVLNCSTYRPNALANPGGTDDGK